MRSSSGGCTCVSGAAVSGICGVGRGRLCGRLYRLALGDRLGRRLNLFRGLHGMNRPFWWCGGRQNLPLDFDFRLLLLVLLAALVYFQLADFSLNLGLEFIRRPLEFIERFSDLARD